MTGALLPVGSVRVRPIVRDDLAAVIALLAADPLGSTRETPPAGDDVPAAYVAAFERLDGDPAHTVYVACDGTQVVGTFQLSIIPGLARGGATRGQLEAVRVREDWRGAGLGEAMLRWAADEARARGCALLQLTTDKRRPDALRFYERLGFEASHEGLKLALT